MTLHKVAPSLLFWGLLLFFSCMCPHSKPCAMVARLWESSEAGLCASIDAHNTERLHPPLPPLRI